MADNASGTKHTPRGTIIHAAQRPHPLWSPLIAASVVLVPGAIAAASGLILLFPSLGPTAVIQAYSPSDPSARFYNVVVSHIVGMASAYAAVFLFGIAHAPAIITVHAVSPARMGAAAVAIALGTFLEVSLRAMHAPSASTTLLVALGAFKAEWRDVAEIVGGVLIVAIVGEIVRRARLHQLGA